MRFLDRIGLDEWVIRENIVIWVVWYRSSDGFYNYKKVAIIVTHPEDKSDMYEADGRRVIVLDVYSGAYQDFSRPEKIINAVKYIARKLKLHCRVVKLEPWYYHFIGY